MIPMVSTMRYWKKRLLDTLSLLLAALMLIAPGEVMAQEAVPNATQVKLEKLDGGLWLSALVDFELPSNVEDALLKGIPVFFVVRVELLRERWYWKDKRVVAARRHIRLSYHPLTQRWRLNISLGEASDQATGLVLNQNFETLSEALGPVKRIFRWRLADLSDIDVSASHVLDFDFALDISQLPRPLQIGTFGQSDWSVSRTVSLKLEPEPGR